MKDYVMQNTIHSEIELKPDAVVPTKTRWVWIFFILLSPNDVNIL